MEITSEKIERYFVFNEDHAEISYLLCNIFSSDIDTKLHETIIIRILEKWFDDYSEENKEKIREIVC